MWDIVIVIVIVSAAAGFGAWSVYRRLRGRAGCDCCEKRPNCPFADDADSPGR